MSYRTIEEALTVGTGTERSFVCHVHADTNPSASVNALTGLWVCYTCGAGGKIDLDRIDIDPEVVTRELRKYTHLVENETRYYAENWLSLYDSNGPGDYWLSRFSLETCQRFRLGHDLDGEWATYPLRDNQGRVLGLVRRNLTEEGPKYKYPHGLDISNYLFNYHACSSEILVLTEGATDAIASVESSYDALAVYGSRMPAKQRLALRRYAPKGLVMAFDSDKAGDRAARVWGEAFPEVVSVRAHWHPAYKDLAAMPVEYRTHVLSEAVEQVEMGLAQSRSEQVGSSTCESNERTIRKTVSIKRSRSSETRSGPRPTLRLVTP